MNVSRLLPVAVRNIVLAVLLVIVALPLGYIVLASMMSDVEVASGTLLPRDVALGNYQTIWSTVDLGRGLTNSLLVAGAVAVVSAIIAVGAAYVLVRYPFRGRRTALRGLLALQSIPGTLLLLPLFMVYSTANVYLNLTVVGTRTGLFVTYLTFALPFSTWIMVSYLRGLPVELEEAAMIDGCSPIGVLRRIVIPLSLPGVVVAAVFAFLLGWNDVLFASVLTRPETETVAVVLQVFGLAQESGDVPLYGQLMASSLVCAAPVVLLYLIFQRYLIGGLAAGGVK